MFREIEVEEQQEKKAERKKERKRKRKQKKATSEPIEKQLLPTLDCADSDDEKQQEDYSVSENSPKDVKNAEERLRCYKVEAGRINPEWKRGPEFRVTLNNLYLEKKKLYPRR